MKDSIIGVFLVCCTIVASIAAIKSVDVVIAKWSSNESTTNQPTPAARSVEPDLLLELAELATDEHRGRLAAERNLDEFRRHAQSVVEKLLNEIQRLQKRPSLKKGSLGA